MKSLHDVMNINIAVSTEITLKFHHFPGFYQLVVVFREVNKGGFYYVHMNALGLVSTGSQRVAECCRGVSQSAIKVWFSLGRKVSQSVAKCRRVSQSVAGYRRVSQSVIIIIIIIINLFTVGFFISS